MLTLAERVKVIDLAVKGKPARDIVLSLGVGTFEVQIQGINSCQEYIECRILERRSKWQTTIPRCKTEQERRPQPVAT